MTKVDAGLKERVEKCTASTKNKQLSKHTLYSVHVRRNLIVLECLVKI